MGKQLKTTRQTTKEQKSLQHVLDGNWRKIHYSFLSNQLIMILFHFGEIQNYFVLTKIQETELLKPLLPQKFTNFEGKYHSTVFLKNEILSMIDLNYGFLTYGGKSITLWSYTLIPYKEMVFDMDIFVAFQADHETVLLGSNTVIMINLTTWTSKIYKFKFEKM